MNLDTFSWRFRVLQSKALGKLPALPWSQVATMMTQPFEKWDYQYFATGLPTGLNDRGVPGMVLYDTAVGRFYGRPEDQDSIGGVIVEEICRVYERPPVAVRPGDVVVDLGGHLGTFTRVALNAGAKLVVAFEANATNANCFRTTFQDEIARGKVVLIESPVWSEPCTVHFSGQGLVGQIADEGEAKEAVTIDDVVRKLDLPRVDFIKTDIEGAERNALLGAAHVLSSYAPRMAVSSYHYPDDPAVLRDIVLRFHPYDVSFDKGEKRMFCNPR
jgi:FkbM family methyltransferase